MNKESEKAAWLCKAARTGCADSVHSLITSEKELNLISDEGDHYLAIASAFGRATFIQVACEHASNNGWQFDFSQSFLDPFLVAIDAGEFTCFQWLLFYLPVSNFSRFYHRCILNNEFSPIFFMLLTLETDFEKRKTVLNEALFRAIESDSPQRHQWVALLLELGANPHYSSEEGGRTVSLLTHAVRGLISIKKPESNQGVFYSLFKALNTPMLCRKFDVYYQSIQEFFLDPKEGASRMAQPSYLDWAAANRHPELIDDIYNSMMQHQCSTQKLSVQSGVELGMALDLPGNVEIQPLNHPAHPLLEPSLFNQRGRTLLMVLAENNQHQLILKLFPLLRQRDFDAVDSRCETAVMMACRQGHIEVFKMLIPKYTGQVNENGDSLLHILCQKGHLEMILICLQNPKWMPLVYVQNKAGFNPILCAPLKFRLKLLLSEHGKLWETSLLFVLASTFALNLIGIFPEGALKNEINTLWQSDIMSRQISILNKVAYYCRSLLSSVSIDCEPGAPQRTLFQSIQASLVIRTGLKLESKPLESVESILSFCRQIVGRLEILLGLPQVANSCQSNPTRDPSSEGLSTQCSSTTLGRPH